MSYAHLSSQLVQEACREALLPIARETPGLAKPGTDYERLVRLEALSIAAVNYGNATMTISPEDFALFSDAFWVAARNVQR